MTKLQFIGFDAANAMLAQADGNGNARYAIEGNPAEHIALHHTIINTESTPIALVSPITFDALRLDSRLIEFAPADGDTPAVYVHRDFVAQIARRNAANDADPMRAMLALETADTSESSAHAYDAATARAEAAFAELAADVPYIESAELQKMIAQTAKRSQWSRDDIENLVLRLYRVIDKTPDGEDPNALIVKAYQRLNVASAALFDARAALLAALTDPTLIDQAGLFE